MRRLLALFLLLAAAALAPSASALVPNDPAWEHQWAQRQMRVPAVWDYTTGSESVVIASVDTGVNPGIADLQGALVPGWDFVDGDASPEDAHGHGTVVATTMVARGNNGSDIAGYCWKCRLMPVRVSTSHGADLELVAAGIRWAIDHGARIVNVGFVHEGDAADSDPTVGAAVRYAVERNVLVVTSAGNTSGGARTFPGAYPGTLAVAGTDEHDALFPWSTRGSWVSLAAPGCQIAVSAGGEWGRICGTSLTAPAVAGVAALALSLKPDLTAEQIARALVTTAVPVAGIGGGRVDAYAALESLGLVPRARRGPRVPAVARTVFTTRTLRGTLRARLRVRVTIRKGGTVKLRLTSRKAASCTLTLGAAGEVWLGTRRRGVLSLAARVPAGRYIVDATCRTRKPQRYTLSLTAPRA